MPLLSGLTVIIAVSRGVSHPGHVRGSGVQSLPLGNRAPAQAGWAERKRYRRRQAAGDAIAPSGQIFREDPMVQKDGSAPSGPDRKAAAYNSARRQPGRGEGNRRGVGRPAGSRRAPISHATGRVGLAPFWPGAPAFMPSHAQPPPIGLP